MLETDAAEPELSQEAVHDLLRKCLGEYGKRGNLISLMGIDYVLDARGHEEEIAALLRQLPEEFRPEKGYAHSFAGAIFDKHGRAWSGDLATVAHLLALGTAVGMVREVFPERMREGLPAQLPYFRVFA